MQNIPGKLVPLSAHASHLQRTLVFGGAGSRGSWPEPPLGSSGGSVHLSTHEGTRTGPWRGL